MSQAPEPESAFPLLKLAHALTEQALSLEHQADFWPLLAERLNKLFACERVSIFQRAAGDDLISRYAHGLAAPLRVRHGEGIVGTVAKSHKGLIVNDPYNDPRFHAGTDKATGYRTHSLMAVPLVHHGRAHGVIELINKNGGFAPKDLESLQYLASQLAVIFLKFSFEEKQKEMTLQLVQAEKLAAIGRMASGVAHEINNPVTAILAVTHRLLKIEPGSPDAVAGLLKADAAARRIHLFVQNLLGFSRASSPSLSPVSLEQIVEGSLQLVGHEFDHRSVRVVKAFEPGAPKVLGDPNSLKQVFINLIVNSLQAMDAQDAKGTLTLRVKGYRGAAGEQVVAEVSDTGPGIAPEAKEKLFEPFFTTKKEGEGTGLGLYIIRGIIERHKGRVEIESEAGSGATFRLFFPKAA